MSRAESLLLMTKFVGSFVAVPSFVSTLERTRVRKDSTGTRTRQRIQIARLTDGAVGWGAAVRFGPGVLAQIDVVPNDDDPRTCYVILNTAGAPVTMSD